MGALAGPTGGNPAPPARARKRLSLRVFRCPIQEGAAPAKGRKRVATRWKSMRDSGGANWHALRTAQMPASVLPAPARSGGIPWAQTLPYGLLRGLLVARASCGPTEELEAETLTAVAEAHCARRAADIHRADNLVKAPTSERRALPVHMPSREDVHEPSCTCSAAGARCARSARTSPIFSD
jgi:hypothetical protein